MDQPTQDTHLFSFDPFPREAGETVALGSGGTDKLRLSIHGVRKENP
jgi:hypothetical protein